MRTTIRLMTVLILATVLLHSGQAARAQQRTPPKFPEELKEQVKYLSTRPMMLRAATMGITVIEGKDISRSRIARNKQGRGHDTRIGVNPNIDENEPTIAANPVYNNYLVAGSHYIPEAGCVVYTSSDGGTSWTSPVAMPLLTDFSFCSDLFLRCVQ